MLAISCTLSPISMMSSNTVDKYDVLWHINMIQVLTDYIKRLTVALEQIHM